jgi:hypothetical protein
METLKKRSRKMKGFIGGLCGLTLAGLTGCYGYHDLVDPCYPARYEAMSRTEFNETIAPQVDNGHLLNQTLWNFYFDVGKDTLTLAGEEKLKDLARVRPAPDTLVWLQTAEDIVYDPGAPNKKVEARTDLDTKRRETVLKFLSAETAGRNLTFQVLVHNPADPDFSANALGRAAASMQTKFGGGGGAGGAGGGGAPAGGGGAAAGGGGTPH